jgi:prephenate dehydrogenase
MTVGIAGLGLIGGSLAKSIKLNTAHSVLGIDINSETMLSATTSGSIDGVLNSDAISQCNIIIIALPPKALIGWINENAPHIKENTIVVDICGVKRNIVSEITPLSQKYGFIYVGGHPMAGKEVSGFSNATAELYKGASMILTPSPDINEATIDLLRSFFLSLGFGKITISTPDVHDRTIAYTSQLAHITSSAYIKSPTAQLHSGYSAGSFRDMTRVAKLDENLWTELFAMNHDYLIDELETLIGNLNQYLTALKDEDWDKMRELLKDGRILKEQSSK